LKSFIKAAQEERTEEEKLEGAITFEHWGNEVTFLEPSEGQLLIMMGMGTRGMARDAAGRFIQLFIEMGDEETQRYFADLLMDRESGFTLNGDGGIFDIWESLVEEWSGKASPAPSASPKRRSGTGTSSTGRSTRARAKTS
jgi:hypothetical protein